MREKATLKVDGRDLQVSHLDKVLFPKSGFTKAQVIDYYVRVSEVILPHLRDRPLTLKIYPKGVNAPASYIKDAPQHTPSWVKTAAVWRRSGKAQIHYVLINDLPSLVWAVNHNNIEMHVFLARAPRIEQPTVLVLDLDPGPPADILDSARVALMFRDTLAQAGLQCFAKSSGSKGIHLFVPLNTPVTYQQTEPFARALAEQFTSEHPELVVTEMAKVARAGKVFIDYSQNVDYKSTACVYCLRAKDTGPFVSMPLRWEELEAAVEKRDPDAFYFRADAALERVRKLGDLFAHVLELKQKLPAVSALKTAPAKAPLTGTDRGKVVRASARKHVPAPKRLLKRYQQKRDFTRTAEPPASAPRAPTADAHEPMFVVQKHAASQLHFDFRLEMEGVLRSWAVPKGPPTEVGERRLAMHVEDHPMDYARFEGIIPAGHYGGGTVMVWDIGTYAAIDGHPVRGFYGGKLHLELKGKKLQGQWALVRSGGSDDEEKRSWYLIRTAGPLLKTTSPKWDRSVLTDRTMEKIARDKSAEWQSNRAPVGDTTSPLGKRSTPVANLPAAKAQFLKPMRPGANTRDTIDDPARWIYEVSFGSLRCMAIRRRDNVTLRSAAGKPLDKQFPGIAATLKAFPAQVFALDGEIVALDSRGCPVPLKSRAKVTIVYYVFDLLNLEDHSTADLPLTTRKELLSRVIETAGPTVRFSASLQGTLDEIVAAAQQQGLKAIRARRADSGYQPGRSSSDWKEIAVKPKRSTGPPRRRNERQENGRRTEHVA